jgi:hypothetical protein
MAEAGTGKSRLCGVPGPLPGAGFPRLEGRGVAHGKAIPMLPILELWRAYYGITEADTPKTTRAKISGRLLLMDRRLATRREVSTGAAAHRRAIRTLLREATDLLRRDN